MLGHSFAVSQRKRKEVKEIERKKRSERKKYIRHGLLT